MMMCCFVFLVASGGGYYFYYGPGSTSNTSVNVDLSSSAVASAAAASADISSTPSSAPASADISSTPSSAPAPADPKAALLATGQAIQAAEVDISTAPPAFTVPTGVPTSGAVSYSMTMDINIAQAGPSWRNIMNHGDPDAGTATTRRPAIFITGNDPAPPNRIHIIHGSTEDNNTNIVTTFAATPGTYFTLTLVVSAGTMTTYINGTADATGTTSATFTWNDASQPWRWNAYLAQLPGRAENTSGTVKVKNAYWFNKALTAAEVTTLATAAASGTSTYRPEPISFGYLTEVGPIERAKLERRQYTTSFNPEPITSSGGDYWDVTQ
jgi:hypothetical protein